MNLLFIGGNRYFGKEVLNRLLKKNLNIYLVNRNTKKETIKHQNLFHIKCNRNDLIKYENIFENVVFDYVFDNIAYNLNDVKYLFKILRNKIKHYIFTSSSITYLGLNDKTVEGLAKKSGDDRFAYDSYKNIIQIFYEILQVYIHYNNLHIYHNYLIFVLDDLYL